MTAFGGHMWRPKASTGESMRGGFPSHWGGGGAGGHPRENFEFVHAQVNSEAISMNSTIQHIKHSNSI